MVPGGSKALRRIERVHVRLAARTGVLPRPDLVGALVLKSCAVDVDDAPEHQQQDVVFLLCPVARLRTLAR
jgi:hypothetical protein